MSVNLIASEHRGRDLSSRLYEIGSITYPADIYPLGDITLMDSPFLEKVRQIFGQDRVITTARSLSEALTSARISPPEVINAHLYDLAELLMEEFTIDHVTKTVDEIEGLWANVFAFLHIYLDERIVSDERVIGLSTQVDALLNVIAGTDRVLYAQIRNLFGLYTRVGTLLEKIDIFDTVTVPAITAEDLAISQAENLAVQPSEEEA